MPTKRLKRTDSRRDSRSPQRQRTQLPFERTECDQHRRRCCRAVHAHLTPSDQLQGGGVPARTALKGGHVRAYRSERTRKSAIGSRASRAPRETQPQDQRFQFAGVLTAYAGTSAEPMPSCLKCSAAALILAFSIGRRLDSSRVLLVSRIM